MKKEEITFKDFLESKLLIPYIEKYKYYVKWGKIHKISYWVFINIQVILGFYLSYSIIIKKDNNLTAFVAIILNFFLIANHFIQFGNKYKRYRITEIYLYFLLLDFYNKFIESDKNLDCFFKENISNLGKKFEEIIKNEYKDHFKELKSLFDLSEKVSLIKDIKV